MVIVAAVLDRLNDIGHLTIMDVSEGNDQMTQQQKILNPVTIVIGIGVLQRQCNFAQLIVTCCKSSACKKKRVKLQRFITHTYSIQGRE